MINFEKTDIYGWSAAIRGARNPMNSWDRTDTEYDMPYIKSVTIGPNDYKLLTNLSNAGSDERKWMRMVVVYVDITAPLYWWKEFDTYKVGTVANSCSTMHKLCDKPFCLDDFSYDHLNNLSLNYLDLNIKTLNTYREMYLLYKDKEMWWQLIQMLPSSYNQKRTIMLNYEVLKNMYNARKNHKLDEWREFCKWIDTLPYREFITGPLIK